MANISDEEQVVDDISENEVSETQSFLDSIPHEGEQLEVEEEDTPTDSSSENEDEKQSPDSEEDKQTEEDNLPFHKHPRWKQIVDKNKELSAQLEQATHRLEEINQRVSEAATSSVPEWFQGYYPTASENTLQRYWDSYKKDVEKQQKVLESELEVKLEQRLLNKKQEEAAQQERVQEWVEDQIQELKDEGLTFKQADLVAVMEKYQPTTDGNLDFRKGYDILSAINAKAEKSAKAKEKDSARKGVAAKTTTGSTGDPHTPEIDMKRIRSMDWHELVE